MPPWWVTSSLLDDVVHGYDVFRGNVSQDVVDLPEHPSAAPAEDAGLLPNVARHLFRAALGKMVWGSQPFIRESHEKKASLYHFCPLRIMRAAISPQNSGGFNSMPYPKWLRRFTEATSRRRIWPVEVSYHSTS